MTAGAKAGACGEGCRARVLVVEDDAAISDVVCSLLSREGHVPTPAYSGTEARLLIEGAPAGDFPFDLVICDLMLPGLPGEDVVALVRERADAPVIVASAKADVESRVALLRTGADDYLVKPFDLDELLARVEALLRRARLAAARDESASAVAAEEGRASTLRFRAWEACEETRSFSAAGALIRLTRTEFDIVCALMRRPRKVFTKRELFETVWREEAAVEEKTVNTHVSNIRTKLKRAAAPDYIDTVWGIGFKLADGEDA